VFSIFCCYGPGSSATGTDRCEFYFRQRQELARILEATEHLIETVSARESRSSSRPPSGAGLKSQWSFAFSPPTHLHRVCQADDRDSLHFVVQSIVMLEEEKAGGIFMHINLILLPQLKKKFMI
jgi:hypothetical protein